MPMAWPLLPAEGFGFSAAVPACGHLCLWDINSTSGHCFFGGRSELSTHSSILFARPPPPNSDYNRKATVTIVKIFGSSDVLFCLLVYYHIISCLH